MEGKKPVGICEALHRYTGSCDKCLLYLGLGVAFIQGAGLPCMFLVMKDMIEGLGTAATLVGSSKVKLTTI